MGKYLEQLMSLIVGTNLTLMSNESIKLSVVNFIGYTTKLSLPNPMTTLIMRIMDGLSFIGVVIIVVTSIFIFIKIIKNRFKKV